MRPGTPGFVGARLKEAREARGLTATSLADLIGVSRQAVSQYENGGVSPHPETMRKISETLNIPIHFFWQDSLDALAVRVIYRSNSSANKLAVLRAERRFGWLIGIVRYLEEFVEVPSVNFPSFRLPSNPYAIADDEIETIALALRNHWGLGDGPINNLVRTLEKHGVIVSRGELESEDLDAFSQWVEDRPFMFLGDDKQAAVRSRFDAAHELGHLVLHRTVDLDYFCRPADRKLMEQQAFKFAGAFLLPAETFGTQIRRATLDSFVILKSRWLVSVGAMIKRAQALNLITESQTTNMWISMSRRGWRRFEPFDDQLSPEEPSTLRLAVQLIVSEGVQTRDQIREYIPYSPRDIEELTGLEPGYLLEEDAGIVSLLRRSGNGKVVGLPTQRNTSRK